MVLTIDLAPTLAEIAAVTAPAGLHGKSLVPLLLYRMKGGQARLP